MRVIGSSCRVAVVVPVLNGESMVPAAAAAIRAALGDRYPDAVIVFVDDGSTDDTWTQITALSGEDPMGIAGVRLAWNVGQARAIAAGLAASAPTRLAFTMDVDLETSPEDLLLLGEAVEGGADLASGRRTGRRRWQREAPSRAFSIYGRLHGLPLRDPGCGTNALSASVAAAFAEDPTLIRELPSPVMWAHADAPVEIGVRSRRPAASQLRHRDLLRLWLTFDRRHGPWPFRSLVAAGGIGLAWTLGRTGRRPCQVPLISTAVLLGWTVHRLAVDRAGHDAARYRIIDRVGAPDGAHAT